MNIIADTSPLISLAILDKLDMLQHIFSEIYLPEAVFTELTIQNKPYAQKLTAFTRDKIIAVKNRALVQTFHEYVDLGESEAIALALEMQIETILIDDAKGRKFARQHGLRPIGTIGILLQAKQEGMVNVIKPELDILVANRIRIGSKLYQHALILAGE
jgi:hypothetical protein